MCEWMPSRRSSGRASTASSARHRRAVAVAATRSRGRTSGPRARWRCTRGRPRARRWSRGPSRARALRRAPRRASATRSISTSESTMIRPTPASSAAAISSSDLLLPCRPMCAPGTPARSATASSPPVAVSTRRPSSCTQRATATRQERLARVVDVDARADLGERRLERAPVAARRASAGRPRRARRPGCRARPRASRTSTPATLTTPSAARRDARRPGLARSHPLRRAHPEQAEPVGEHLAGRVVEPQARAVHVADLLVAERRDPALVVPLVVRRRRAPRGSARRGAARAARRPARRSAGSSAIWPEQHGLARVVEQRGVEAVLAAHARVGGVAGDVRPCGRARTARRTRGSRSSRCVSRSRSRSICESADERASAYRAASTPTASTRSSMVTTVPARLDIRTGWPSLTRLTSWPMRISRLTSGVSPNAAQTAIMRPTYPWWSAPSMMTTRSNPRSRLSR